MKRFTTVETASLSVVKRSGVTEPFSRTKVINGVRKACPLRELDEVAYLRFASVYQAFDSLEDFEEAIELLRKEREEHATKVAAEGAAIVQSASPEGEFADPVED